MNVLFLTNNGFGNTFKNYNKYQRVNFKPDFVNLYILLRKGETANSDISSKAEIFEGKFKSKIFYLFYTLYWITINYNKLKLNYIITEPSYLTIAGFYSKLLFNIKWGIDIWDIPFRNLNNIYFFQLSRCSLDKIISIDIIYCCHFLSTHALRH